MGSMQFPGIQWEFQDPTDGGTLVPYKAIFCGDIPLHRPYIGLIYGRYLQFRFLKWPLRDVPRSPKEDGYPINRNHKHNNSDNKTVQVDDNP